MTISYLLYAIIGKLLIYMGMKFPPFSESRFIFVKRLFSCDECLGVWIFTGLSFVMGEALFREYFYFPVASEAITGIFTSFLVHLIYVGWKTKFEILVIN